MATERHEPDDAVGQLKRPPQAAWLIRSYLLQHAVSTCHGHCAMCKEAIAWLRANDAVPIGITLLLAAPA